MQSNRSILKNLQSRTTVLPTPASCTFAKKECDVSYPICQIYFPSEFDKRCFCAAFPAHVVDLAANSIGNPELCRSFCFKRNPLPLKYALQLGFTFLCSCFKRSPSLKRSSIYFIIGKFFPAAGIMSSVISFAIGFLLQFCPQSKATSG